MDTLFLPFKTDISKIPLPEKFTFPFYYTPHELSIIASTELQGYIEEQTEWHHNFGLKNEVGIGKMFGVLICKNTEGKVGQLWAFSGKLAESNHWSFFVPPVFDTLKLEGFYKKGEVILNDFNHKIEFLESDQGYLKFKKEILKLKDQSLQEINTQKKRIKTLKIDRDKQRFLAVKKMPEEAFKRLEKQLKDQSKSESIQLKQLKKYWKSLLEKKGVELMYFENKINELKLKRQQKSALLQNELFKSYQFLNKDLEIKNVKEIFKIVPPAGTGECCAPKLLQYAFKNNLTPITMAEFWWGKSPNSEIRHHGNFYPSCNSKCKPLLMGHMLKGLNVEENPLQVSGIEKQIEIVYEDKYMLVINKPYNLLSVPGKTNAISTYDLVKKIRPNEDMQLVHRLDRATSGLLLVAKNKEMYVKLQRQFSERTIKKRYVALLDGILKQQKGTINLPIRVDIEDRPRQVVCYKYGKQGVTYFEVQKIKNNKTLIYLYPVTGRTHQLRVHCAHKEGLGIPIVGDDLYGSPSLRLYLHAEYIGFKHPVSGKFVEFQKSIKFL